MSYEEASVIISGASKGIGFAIAKVFAQKTRRPLVLLARNYNQLESARKELIAEGAKSIEIFAADLTIAGVLDTLDFESLNPGILVNNAGSFLAKPLQETSAKEYTRQFEINALGAFNLTKKVLPTLLKQERGLIVNISSQAALKGYGESGAYAMSKHALLGFTRSLRQELINTSVAVSAINLGQTWSTSWEGSDVDPKRLINPEDVGQLVLTLSQLSVQTVAEEISLMPQSGEL